MPNAEDSASAKVLLKDIFDRCEKASIEYRDNSTEEDDGGFDVDVTVLLPSGRTTREIWLFDLDDLRAFSDICFEDYIAIGNYTAICCYEQNRIEASISMLTETRFSGRRPITSYRKILKTFGLDVKPGQKSFERIELVSDDPAARTKIFITPWSNELTVLNPFANGALDIALVIESPKIKTHAEAIKLLEKVSHSLFFAVEVQNNIALSLDRKGGYRARNKPIAEFQAVGYPNFEYDAAPMSLYWYARSAINMPLLQFLAFYQTIEFYFPVYFNADINRKVRSIMKSPAFKIENDSDISRITTLISSRGGRFGSERDSLKATLRQCVEQVALEEFLTSNESRSKFFTSTQKGITQFPISFKNIAIDLVDQVAQRIYDIRCKVVHVKSEDGDTELELLLPYTEEAEKLVHDIELVQFLAKNVLISSSAAEKF